MAYWYNIKTGAVETEANRSKPSDLLGPYPTRGDAERALEHAHERTDAWEAEEADES